jgi:hypothetical protein
LRAAIVLSESKAFRRAERENQVDIKALAISAGVAYALLYLYNSGNLPGVKK